MIHGMHARVQILMKMGLSTSYMLCPIYAIGNMLNRRSLKYCNRSASSSS